MKGVVKCFILIYMGAGDPGKNNLEMLQVSNVFLSSGQLKAINTE